MSNSSEEKSLSILRENESLRMQLAELEQQHANLTTLYVACFRLHSTLDREDVLGAIQEIIINMVGCEELAILELDGDAKLTLTSSFGIDAARFGVAPRIDASVRSGEIWIRDEDEEPHHLTAVVPLVLGDRVIGAIALFRLLQHKQGLEAIDRELFELLGTHAAMALHTTTPSTAVCAL